MKRAVAAILLALSFPALGGSGAGNPAGRATEIASAALSLATKYAESRTLHLAHRRVVDGARSLCEQILTLNGEPTGWIERFPPAMWEEGMDSGGDIYQVNLPGALGQHYEVYIDKFPGASKANTVYLRFPETKFYQVLEEIDGGEALVVMPIQAAKYYRIDPTGVYRWNEFAWEKVPDIRELKAVATNVTQALDPVRWYLLPDNQNTEPRR